jgi:hypothetical protein
LWWQFTASVVTVKRRQVARQPREHQLQHRLAVGHRVLLRPMHRLDVIGEVLAALGKVGQIAIRQVDHVARHVLSRQLDEVRRDGVADAPAARVQHHPDLLMLVQADLDEVVAAAERAHLVRPLGELAERLEQLRVALGQRLEAGSKGRTASTSTRPSACWSRPTGTSRLI